MHVANEIGIKFDPTKKKQKKQKKKVLETPEPKINKKERNQMVRWNEDCQGAWKDKKKE
jgi:hypothetical protein